jgi:hypothetical protein
MHEDSAPRVIGTVVGHARATGKARDSPVADGRAAPTSIYFGSAGHREAREVAFRRHRGESVKSEWSVMVIGGPNWAR